MPSAGSQYAISRQSACRRQAASTPSAHTGARHLWSQARGAAPRRVRASCIMMKRAMSVRLAAASVPAHTDLGVFMPSCRQRPVYTCTGSLEWLSAYAISGRGDGASVLAHLSLAAATNRASQLEQIRLVDGGVSIGEKGKVWPRSLPCVASHMWRRGHLRRSSHTHAWGSSNQLGGSPWKPPLPSAAPLQRPSCGGIRCTLLWPRCPSPHPWSRTTPAWSVYPPVV